MIKRPVNKTSRKKPVSRMKAYIERQKKRGLNNVCVWVPDEYAYKIRKIADELRRESGINNPRSVALYGDDDE